MDWQPFFLNHNTPEEGEDMYEHLAHKYGPQKAALFTKPNNPLDVAGSKVGITFNPARRIIRTADSHRLVEWCKETAPHKEDALMDTIFKAYFSDAKDLAKHAELVACATAIGLDGTECASMLSSSRYVAEVNTKAKGWSSQGVNGVPFFVVHSNDPSRQPVAFSGAQPSELIAEVLTDQA